MKVLLIIPSYNEEKNILNVKKEIDEYNKNNKLKYDYVFINDFSTDLSEQIFKDNKINSIHLVHNLGIGGAVQTGYKYALENDYDIAVQFDGDNQHDINHVKTIINPLLDNECDMVVGSRFIEEKDGFKSSFMRRTGIKIISMFIKIFTSKKIHDTTSGFRAINKRLIKEFSKYYPTEYPEPVSTVTILKKGYRIIEVSVTMKERTEGKSSIHTWKSAYYMINVLLSIIATGLRREK